MKRLHVGLWMVWMVAGCVGGSKEIGATVADTEGESGSGETTGDTASSTGLGTMSASSTSTGNETQAETTGDPTVGSESTETEGETTGGLESCEDAQTQAQCDAFPGFDGGGFFECGWQPTPVFAGLEACEPVRGTGVEGACVQLEQTDTCSTLETPTCPDDATVVFFQALGLEIGAVQILSLPTGTCSEASAGFEPCVVIDDGETITYDPPECACGCPPI
jgi:hypothetical protein